MENATRFFKKDTVKLEAQRIANLTKQPVNIIETNGYGFEIVPAHFALDRNYYHTAQGNKRFFQHIETVNWQFEGFANAIKGLRDSDIYNVTEGLRELLANDSFAACHAETAGLIECLELEAKSRIK